MLYANEDADNLGVPGSRPEDYEEEIPASTPAPSATQEAPDYGNDEADTYFAQSAASSIRPAPAPPALDISNPDALTQNIARLRAHREAQRAHQASLEKAETAERKRQHNAQARMVARQTGAKFQADADNFLQPVTHEDGAQAFSPSTSPVRYHSETGKPYQVAIDERGQPSTKDPDAEAPLGPNETDPDDPFIYRKRKHTAWDPIDPEEGIHSPDRRIASASAKHLWNREYRTIDNEKTDLDLKLKDPQRPKALTDQQREELLRRAEAFRVESPRPEPKKTLFGQINQEATSQAEAEWQTAEDERRAALAEMEAALAGDEERNTLEQRSYELLLKQTEMKKEGVLGYLGRRRKEQAARLENLPEAEAAEELEIRNQALEIEGQALNEQSAALQARSEALQTEMTRGVTAVRAGEIQAEMATLQQQSESLQARAGKANAIIEATNAGLQARQQKEAEARKAERDQMRQDPGTAPIADALDSLDAETESRMAEIAKIADPQARQAAIEVLEKDIQSKFEGIQKQFSEVEVPQEEEEEKDKPFFGVSDTISGIWDAVKGLGVTAPAAFYQLVEGLDRPDKYSEAAQAAFAEADAFTKEMQRKNSEEGATDVGSAFREAGGSLGFSLGSMAAAIPASIAGGKIGAAAGSAIGAAAGLPAAGVGAVPGAGIGAAIGGTIGGVTAGMAASGTAAYRMAGAQFLNETFNAALAEYESVNGSPMPEDKRKEVFDALMPIAVNTALWEAGPEAVGNAFMLGAGKIILGSTSKKIATEAAKLIPGMSAKRIAAVQAGKVVGSAAEREAIKAATKTVGSRFLNTKLGKLTAAAANIPTELATETATNVEQSADQQKGMAIALGEDPNQYKADWSAGGIATAFQEIAPQTLALLALMGGGTGAVKGGLSAMEKVRSNAAQRRAKATQPDLESLAKFSPQDGQMPIAPSDNLPTLEQKLFLVQDALGQMPETAAPEKIATLEAAQSALQEAIVAQGGRRKDALLPEVAAAIQVEIDQWDADPRPETVTQEREAARGSIKLIQGKPLESLLASEQAALKTKLPSGAPRLEEINGVPVLSQGQIERLRTLSPTAAEQPAIADEQTVRDRANRIPLRPDPATFAATETPTEEQGAAEPASAVVDFDSPQQAPASATPQQQQSNTKTPDEWAKDAGLRILDADGWRIDGSDYSTPITWKEFRKRANASTISPNAGTDAITVLGSEVPPAPNGKPLSRTKQFRYLNTEEKIHAQQIGKGLAQQTGAAINEATAFAARFIVDNNMDLATPEAVAQAWEKAGGNENAAAILEGLIAEGNLEEASLNRLTDAAMELVQTTKNETLKTMGRAKVKKMLSVIAPAISLWAPAFSGVRVTMKDEDGAGVRVETGNILVVSIPELMNEAALYFARPGRAEITIEEEVIHAIGKTVLKRIATQMGITEQALVELIWGDLPASVQTLVEKSYGRGNDYQLGHEFLRMLVSKKLSLDGNRISGLSDEVVITEQTLPDSTLAIIRKYLAGLIRFLDDAIKNLTNLGTPKQSVEIIRKARDEVAEIFQNTRKQIYRDRDAAYQKEYARLTGKQLPRGSNTSQQEGQRGQDGAGIDSGTSGLDQPWGGPNGDGVEASGGAAQLRAELDEAKKKLAAYEQDKAERESKERYRAEKLDRAAAIKGSKLSDWKALLSQVPEDLRPMVQEQLEKLSPGKASYVLLPNGERSAVQYVAASIDTPQASHTGPGFAPNPLHLGNSRDYAGDPAEQAKVNAGRTPGALNPDILTSESVIVDAGPPGFILAIHPTAKDANGQPQIVPIVIQGNGRQQMIQGSPTADRDALTAASKEKAEQFGVESVQDGQAIYRFFGFMDLREAEQAKKFGLLVDNLNPASGVVQDTPERAFLDANKIPAAALEDIPLNLSAAKAQEELAALLRADFGLDRNRVAPIAGNPVSAQTYMQWLLLGSAFQDKALSRIYVDEKTSGNQAFARLVEEAARAAIGFRADEGAGLAGNLASLLGSVADNLARNGNLPDALTQAASQIESQQLGGTSALIPEMAGALQDLVETNKAGRVLTEATGDNFAEFFRVMRQAIAGRTKDGDMFGEAQTPDQAMREFLRVWKDTRTPEPALKARRGVSLNPRAQEIARLRRKAAESGLSKWESDTLTRLEKAEGQEFMAFFDETRDDTFSLEQQTIAASRPPAAEQMALLARPGKERKQAASVLRSRLGIPNDGWEFFKKDENSLGIPRSEMPQVPTDARGALVNFLQARGVVTESKTVSASTLRPTQAEYSPEKVKKSQQYDAGRSVLVSSDNYVLDGHHQWMASKGGEVAIIQLDIPVRQALAIIDNFPSTKVEKLSRTRFESEEYRYLGEASEDWRKSSNPEAQVTNPVDPELSPDAKVLALQALSVENIPTVKRILARLKTKLKLEGGKFSLKEPDRIQAKASRPSIRQENPWHDIEHVRDSLRFKVKLNHFRSIPGIMRELQRAGVKVIKFDTKKMFAPKAWGWRFVAWDLQMPNGQLVEFYAPLPELETVKDKNHLLFEKWRNENVDALSPAQKEAYLADVAESKRSYDADFFAALQRMGYAAESEASAAWNNSVRIASSLISSQSDIGPDSAPMVQTERSDSSQASSPRRRMAARPFPKTNLAPDSDSQAEFQVEDSLDADFIQDSTTRQVEEGQPEVTILRARRSIPDGMGDLFDMAAPSIAPEATRYQKALDAEGITEPAPRKQAIAQDLQTTPAQTDLLFDLLGNPLTEPKPKRSKKENYDSRPTEENADVERGSRTRSASGAPPTGGMGDLFSSLAGQRDTERNTGGSQRSGELSFGDDRREGNPPSGMPHGGQGRSGTDASDLSVSGKLGGPGGRTSTSGTPRKGRKVARPGAGVATERPAKGTPERNVELTRDQALAPRGVVGKLRANLAAIRIIKALTDENRLATAEEKQALLKFSGWGSLSQAFDDDKAYNVERGEIETRRETAERMRGYGNSDFYRSQIENQEKAAQSLENWKNQWYEAHTQIKELLSPQEYRAAQESTINAHYTSPTIVAAMWDIVKWMGFKGGNVLEPGAGIGHFFGLMPEEIADRSKLFGVELDPYTAKILKALYPEADIQNTGFQTSDIADNSIDLAISNVPFANVPVADPALEAMGGPTSNLHDYFFGKTLTKLKPGGVMVFITSAFSMDKGASEIRKWLNDRADLVAAYRLPNDAFRENAGTDVVTDIIILRKKDGKAFPHAQSWVNLADAVTQKGEPIRINEYFASHPKNILGLLDNDGSMYGNEKEMTVHGDPTRHPAVAIQQDLATLPTDIFGEVEESGPVRNGVSVVKMGNIIEQDGLFYFQGQENPDPDLNNPKNRARVIQYLDARDTLNTQYDLELSETATDEEIEANRTKLNRAYDRFLAKFGYFHAQANKNLFIDDPDYFRLLGAEVDKKVNRGTAASAEEIDAAAKRGIKKEYEKADIFTKRVLEPRSEPTRADTLTDAFGISLGWRNRVDSEFIAELLGQTPSQVETALVAQEIAVRDPETGLLYSREQYLSGNVRKKLEVAQAAGPEYARNVALLEAVQPQRVGIADIRFKVGATWIPESIYNQFLSSLGLQGYSFAYKTQNDRSEWEMVRAKQTRRVGVEYKNFETPSAPLEALFDALLNLRSITINLPTREGGGRDEAATAAAREKAKLLSERFVTWARETPEIAGQLEDAFNREVNSHVQRTYDGQFLSFPWANKDFNIFPDKKNTIWRAIQEGFGLIAHGVGGGKTIIGSAIALEMRRLGLARKPMIVVHNSTLEGFAKEIAAMAPTARVLVGRKDELGGDKRREFLMRIAAGDWDAVVIAHSTFGLIEDDPAVEIAHTQNLVDEAMDALRDKGYETLQDAQEDRRKSPTVKALVKQVQTLRGKIEKASARRTDTGLLNFQQLGVDALIVDEVHEFKKIPFSTQLEAKGIDGTMSAKANALFMRARQIQSKMGGKNIFSMTGTPVTNTLGEIWNMIRLVAPNVLRDYNVELFDQFVSKFAEVTTESEMGASGEFKNVDRLSKFINLPEWSTFLRLAADVKLGTDLVVKNRPGIKGGAPELVAVPRSKGVTEWVRYIRQVLEAFSEMDGEALAADPRLTAVPVQAFMASRAAAIDIRLVEPQAKDEPDSKVNTMLKRVMDIYNRTSSYSGTQVIFADSFNQQRISIFDLVMANTLNIELDPAKGQDSTFNLYEDIRQKLIAMGVPEEEIAVITDSKWNNDKKKQALFDMVNAGKIRIVLGSTKKLGTGVNMQRLMYAAHHLDVPWTPAELEQRDGRVFRQGNIHGEMGQDIELIRYGMKDTLDAALWQKLETKQRFAYAALSGKITGREIAEDKTSLSLEEQRAVLSGKYGQRKWEIETRLAELRLSLSAHRDEADRRQREKDNAKNHLRILTEMAARQEPIFDRMQALAESIEKEGVKITVNGVSFETKTETIEAINAELEKSKHRLVFGQTEPVAEPVTSIAVNGKPIYLHADGYESRTKQSESGAYVTTYTTWRSLLSSPADAKEDVSFGNVTSPGTLFARLEELGEAVANGREAKKSNLAAVRQVAEMSDIAPWNGQEEYDRLNDEYQEVVRLYRASLNEAAQEAAQETESQEDAPLKARRGISVDREGDGAYAALDRLLANEAPQPFLQELPDEYQLTFNFDPENQREAATEFDINGDDRGTKGNVGDRKSPLDRIHRPSRILGLAISSLGPEKTGSLVGKRIAGTQDVAVISEIYRDPRFETLRYYWTDEAGTIIHEDAVSARLVGEAPLLPDMEFNEGNLRAWVSRRMKAVGASSFYLVHNHPSGSPVPSGIDSKTKGDAQLTRLFAEVFPAWFKGHIIINHKKYGAFDKHGEFLGVFQLEGDTTADPLMQPSIPHQVLGNEIKPDSYQEDIAAIAKQVEQSKETFTLIGASTKGVVRTVLSIDKGLLKTPQRLGALLYRVARTTGSAFLFIGNATSADIETHRDTIAEAIKNRFISDIIDTDGKSFAFWNAGNNVKTANFNKHRSNNFFQEDAPLPVDPAQAKKDGEMFPVERLRTHRDLASKIANGYADFSEATQAEIQQEALMALVNAAKNFDATKGVPFENYAGRVISNRLKGLYRKEMTHRDRFPVSMDAPVGTDREATFGDFQPDRRNPSASQAAATNEASAIIDELLDAMPEKMARVVRGFYAGIPGPRLAEELGVTKQAVNNLQKKAFERMRRQLGERGITTTEDVLMARGSAKDTQALQRRSQLEAMTEFDASLPELTGLSGRALRESAKALHEKQKTSKFIMPDGREIAITTRGWKESNMHSADARVLHIAANLQALLNRSIPLWSEPNTDPRFPNVKMFHNYGTRATVAGRDSYIRFVIREDTNGEIHYDHDATSVEAFDTKKAGKRTDQPTRNPNPGEDLASLAKNRLWQWWHSVNQDSENIQAKPGQKPSGDPSSDPIADLMAWLENNEDIPRWQDLAAQELPGQRTVGRPDLAYGASNPDVMGLDQAYTEKFEAQSHEQWQQEADRMLASDYAKTKARIQQAGLTGVNLTPAETKAAAKIAADLRKTMLESGKDEDRKAFNVFWWAYRKSGTSAGQTLASRRDPLATPADRHREFLMDLMTRPRKKARQAIDAAQTEAERQAELADLRAKLAQAQARGDAASAEVEALRKKIKEAAAKPTKEYLIDEETKALLEKLKANGITPADIMGDKVKLSMVERKAIDSFIDALKAAPGKGRELRQRAFRMILANRSWKEIADKTGVTEAEAKQMKADFIAKMRTDNFGKFLAGMDRNGEMTIGSTKVSPQVAEATFKLWLEKLGIRSDATQGKRKFDIEDPAHVFRMARAIQAATQSSWQDMAYEWWIMNILSGPQTQVVNITGNAANVVWDMTIQRGMEVALNSMIRDSKSAQAGEFKWLLKGILPGMSRGLTMAVKAWNAENDFFESTILGTPTEMHVFDKAGNTRSAIPGAAGRIIRIPGRALLFADAWFKMAIWQAEVSAQAYRQAKSEGLKGRQLADRIALLSLTREEVIAKFMPKASPSEEMVEYFARQVAKKDDTTTEAEQMADTTSLAWERAREQAAFDAAKAAGWNEEPAKRAVAKAKEMTFQEELKTTDNGGTLAEDLASKLQSARTGNPLLGIFFPFVRTPFNIFRIGLRKSPLGSLSMLPGISRGLFSLRKGQAYTEGHPTAVRDFAEQAIAWAITGLLWSAVQGDDDDDEKMLLITGSSPFGVEKRGVRDLNNRVTGGPFTIRIGGRNGLSFSYGRLEPFATVLGTMADGVRAWKRNGTAGENMQAFWDYLIAQTTDKTFLQGFTSIADALNGGVNPVEGTKKFALTALVPNIIRQPMRNFDNLVRESKLAPEAYTSFPSGSLATPRVDLYGQEQEKGGNALVRMFINTPLATNERLADADKMLLHWNRENPAAAYAPQPPAPTYTKNGELIKMTGEQYERFSRLAGKILVASLKGAFTQSEIKKPTEENIDRLRSLVAKARDQARDQIFLR